MTNPTRPSPTPSDHAGPPRLPRTVPPTGPTAHPGPAANPGPAAAHLWSAAAHHLPGYPPPMAHPPFPFIPVQQNAPPAGLEGPLAPFTPHSFAPTRGRVLRNMALGAAAMLVVIGGLAVALVLLGTPTTGPTRAMGPGPEAPNLPSGVNAAEAVLVWYAAGGQARIEAISHDFEATGAAAHDNDLAALTDACVSLRSDIAAAAAYREVPDAIAQRHWAAGLEHHARAAAHCITGVRLRDAGMFEQAVDEMAAGNSEVAQAAARIKQLQPN